MSDEASRSGGAGGPKPDVLLAIDLAPFALDRLRAHFTVHQALTPEARAEVAARAGARVRAIVTNGTTLIPAALIAALPNLGIICAQGVGYEGVDLAAARVRGIVVTHGTGTNADCVADHALALFLAVLRDIPRFDAAVRAGRWREGGTARPGAHGKRAGILGLGGIGGRIARRCAGFDMAVRYHNRRPVPDVPWDYAPSLSDLCAWADVLFVALPGGAATRHCVGGAALDALGPAGFLVNVGRGSVVDTDALVEALGAGRLAGAGLDVIEGEPEVPAALRALPNVVLSPHIAGRSPETMEATIGQVVGNLAAFFSGAAVLSPIPDRA
ncbi:2-hydroxyacid dehydrogenase [Methylobacterium sp. J-026]|uniref:2-hydroxyacid dehydrogenase n=1 Tax=Methylobacterium sp. J-026 TaxID=2836624 RepID=UPI001FBB670F|nr:2-hydroxyacid dehydrogenase [Methylobacterium sp. J-026]MCJ2134203.1 2-hydroxyacid dehydrogenase [Methylobacterium sp. J-026]